MRKAHFLMFLSVFVSFDAFAQSSPYWERSLQQSFNFENWMLVLESPQFQTFLIVMIGVAAAIWVAYLWGSLKMAYNGLEVNIFRWMWSLPKSIRLPQGIPADPDMPHLRVWSTGRLGLAPQITTIEHTPSSEESSQEQDESYDSRGNTPSQRN